MRAILLALVLVVAGVGFATWYVDYRPCNGCRPPVIVSMNPTFAGNGRCGDSSDYNSTYNVTLHPSATVTTSSFGVSVHGFTLPPLAPSPPSHGLGAGCSVTGGGWFAVLWSTGGAPLATYGNLTGHDGWTALAGSTLPVEVPEGDILEVLSFVIIAGDEVYFFGTGGASVTGNATLV